MNVQRWWGEGYARTRGCGNRLEGRDALACQGPLSSKMKDQDRDPPRKIKDRHLGCYLASQCHGPGIIFTAHRLTSFEDYIYTAIEFGFFPVFLMLLYLDRMVERIDFN
jgi:hypothetical protein